MTLEKFLDASVEEKKEALNTPERQDDPFWLLQMRDAVENSYPLSVMFDRGLVDAYWEINQTVN